MYVVVQRVKKSIRVAESYAFVCAKTIFVNGMTLSTEFNKSHICAVCGKKRECGEITSFSADVTFCGRTAIILKVYDKVCTILFTAQ